MCDEPKVFNNQTCQCECKAHEVPAKEWLWDDNKCEAVCNRSCTAPQAVDAKSCTCGCPNITTLTDSDKLIKHWNNDTCAVECNNKKPAVPSPGKHWDEGTCVEVCDDFPCAEICLFTLYSPDPLNGGSVHTYGFLCRDKNLDTCSCDCLKAVDNVPYDKTIKYWNARNCDLECIRRPPNLQPANSTWNPDTCQTECIGTCINSFVRPPLNQDNPDCTCICPAYITKENCNFQYDLDTCLCVSKPS